MKKIQPAYLAAYLAATVVFCLFDFVWLTVVAKDFYQSQLGSLMLAEPKLIPAAVFYLVYLFGLLIFAIIPAMHKQSWITATTLSALLGLVAYGTYDLSNLATLKGWSASLAVIDIVWGAFVSAASGTAGYCVTKAFQDEIHD